MKRSTMKRKTPLKAGTGPARKPMRRSRRKAANDARHDSHPIRQAARGELCTVQIAGLCRHNTETTVLAHLPFEGGIMGGKVSDLSACFSCDVCHSVIDGVRPWPGEEGRHRDWYLRRAMVRTLRRLVEKGVITIEGGRPMMSISSHAGRRLARAKAALDALDTIASRPAIQLSDEETRVVLEVSREWALAANEVADELIAQGFHEAEGD